MQPRTLTLTQAEREALERMRDHDPTPYKRERAAAILKIAQGAIAEQVARTGLHKPRDPDTVRSWLDRYLAAGPAGLTIRPGRGRKPAFSPCRPGCRGGTRAPAGSGAT
jgi:Helix-turn-helix domain